MKIVFNQKPYKIEDKNRLKGKLKRKEGLE